MGASAWDGSELGVVRSGEGTRTEVEGGGRDGEPRGAQLLRAFPEKARLARLEMRIFPEALLDGETVRLAAAARIHDAHNRIVMPASLSGTHDVLVEDDASGQIGRIWILTPEELAAARERKKNR
jgi:hypothetical protein